MMPFSIYLFTNQEQNRIDEGYNLDGRILHIPEEPCDDEDKDIYFQSQISAQLVPSPPPIPHTIT